MTQVTFSESENNVQLVNKSVIPVTSYENLDFDCDDTFDSDLQNDFMTKENFTDDNKKRRLSSVKRWSSSSKGTLEITPDPESF